MHPPPSPFASAAPSLLAVAVLIGCGGSVVVDGTGTGGAGGWQPCAGKTCGDDCTPCDPADPDCALPGTPMYCDSGGSCVIDPPPCPSGCTSDSQCAQGSQWCVGGACVACDNSGTACDLFCDHGWGMLDRNGCTPCQCFPPNACTVDADCGAGFHCYPGALCWDWCPTGDASCCVGNMCATAGCSEPPPIGCFARGCPAGQSCDAYGCSPSSCGCSGGGWACTDDCGGGTCVTPL